MTEHILFETPEELAGPVFDELAKSKEATLAHLSASEYRVRIAAILLCETKWQCEREPRVVDACLDVANSAADDSYRVFAINSLGRIMNSSKSPQLSRFLAGVVIDASNSNDVRAQAYWALRLVQFGFTEQDFDSFLRRTIFTVKSVIRCFPSRFSEDSVKHILTPNSGFPDDFWYSAEDIDFEFVRACLAGHSPHRIGD